MKRLLLSNKIYKVKFRVKSKNLNVKNKKFNFAKALLD